jgi:hypothetical protein
MALVLLLEAHVLRVMDFLRIKTPGLGSLILGFRALRRRKGKTQSNLLYAHALGVAATSGINPFQIELNDFGGNV